MTFVRLLTKPAETVMWAKKNGSTGNALAVLVGAGVLSAIAAAIGVSGSGIADPTQMVIISFTALMIALLLGIFNGYLTYVIANVLGAKGKYWQGLTAASYSSFAPSLGKLIAAGAATLAVLGQAGGIIGLVIGFIALAVTHALGFATYFKAVKELYSTDMVTALVLTLVFVASFVLALLSTVLGALLPALGNLGGLGGLTGLGGA